MLELKSGCPIHVIRGSVAGAHVSPLAALNGVLRNSNTRELLVSGYVKVAEAVGRYSFGRPHQISTVAAIVAWIRILIRLSENQQGCRSTCGVVEIGQRVVAEHPVIAGIGNIDVATGIKCDPARLAVEIETLVITTKLRSRMREIDLTKNVIRK